jgi:hypothetical protein
MSACHVRVSLQNMHHLPDPEVPGCLHQARLGVLQAYKHPRISSGYLRLSLAEISAQGPARLSVSTALYFMSLRLFLSLSRLFEVASRSIASQSPLESQYWAC